MEKLLTEKKRGELKILFIALLFIANVSFANNPLIGKWVLIDECRVLVEGDLSTIDCLSDMGTSRDARKVFYEDGTYEMYYKFLDWEKEVWNITSPDVTFGTYVVEENKLTYSEKRLRGIWEFSVDKIEDREVLVLHNVKRKKAAFYVKVREVWTIEKD